MSNLAKLEFLALDITGNNYLSWVLDAKIHLNANNLGDTIKEGNTTSTQDKVKVMIFLRHHIHADLKTEYLTVKDPLDLWTKLTEIYDHQKTVILPRARYDWVNLRFQDFQSISEYNSAMFRITSQLILCGQNITDEDMMEKTFATFHASNVILQQQYRERGFTKYCDLISYLLVAEQNNELLMKNHETRPVGTAPFPEANVAAYNDKNGSRGRGYHRGRGRGRGRGHGYNRGSYHGVQFKNTRSHHKGQEHGKKPKYESDKKTNVTTSNACHRCGSNNHWARTCCTPKHFVTLYQQSVKNKGKGMETNFAYGNIDIPNGHNEHTNTTALDVDDFIIDPIDMNSGDIMDDTPNFDASNFHYI
ncbi:uncharacterized protein LOC143608596 [Bidens hawaiensis]|uniref:uncharacterized protein LOC143608596 n=1 Tax=Bidens hawaiensis TaxID=980011 RepID=UPI00404A8A43